MQADIQIENHGSIFTFTAATPLGTEVLRTVESEGWQWLGSSLCVEPRYAGDVAEYCVDNGCSLS